jgi:hypothetical protein
LVGGTVFTCLKRDTNKNNMFYGPSKSGDIDVFLIGLDPAAAERKVFLFVPFPFLSFLLCFICLLVMVNQLFIYHLDSCIVQSHNSIKSKSVYSG